MSTEREILQLEIELLAVKEKIVRFEQRTLRRQLDGLVKERSEIRKILADKRNQLNVEQSLPF